ncbi:hypothetical protein DFH07DRAFT_951680 [Mycena maculata]|uniref:CNNM transmembrane domain-containing protein n=1 Tax=Mycena maculata TaxID=230809 RepID=A0AAD7K1W2_9AGAR|nr:hypothetical protein DFH07DRAFT_951680 [Mycena maculata]
MDATSPLMSGLALVEKSHEHPGLPLSGSEFWQRIGVSIILVVAGGVFSGLTLGLMGLDELHLRVLAISSEDATKRLNARKVLALLEKGRHWVLVVLLLCNVIINESLPIFLDSAIGSGLGAVALSTTAILIFGEYDRIIPQAFSVRYGLSIGAACAPLVLFVMYLLSPVAYPIARLLDFVLGVDEGGGTYGKTELKSFLQFHRTGEEPLREEEIGILGGVLDLGNKRVEEIMTPMRDVITLSADAILDERLVDSIVFSGQTGRAHLLLISRTPGKAGGAIGIITLEGESPSVSVVYQLESANGLSGDIIEEILSTEIVDETDRYADNLTRQRAQRITTAAVLRGIVEHRRGVSASRSSRGGGARTPLIDIAERAPLMHISEHTSLLEVPGGARSPSVQSVYSRGR